jgi:signal transduction histidine kinase
VETASMLAPPNATETIQHLGIVAKTLKSCREELRNCLWDLRNDTLGEKTMNAAITSILSPHIGDTIVTVEFNVPRDIISDSTAHAILRIIRELVQNAIRHGKASVININGHLTENKLLFSIKDNGCGFDIKNAPGVRQGHFGLQGIHERINQLGGEMCINSNPGIGTTISISIKK